MIGDVANLVVPGKMLKRGQSSCKVGEEGMSNAHNLKLSSVNLFLMDSS